LERNGSGKEIAMEILKLAALDGERRREALQRQRGRDVELLSATKSSTSMVWGDVAGSGDAPSLRQRHLREAALDLMHAERLAREARARESRARARRRNVELQVLLVALEAKFARRKGARA